MTPKSGSWSTAQFQNLEDFRLAFTFPHRRPREQDFLRGNVVGYELAPEIGESSVGDAARTSSITSMNIRVLCTLSIRRPRISPTLSRCRR